MGCARPGLPAVGLEPALVRRTPRTVAGRGGDSRVRRVDPSQPASRARRGGTPPDGGQPVCASAATGRNLGSCSSSRTGPPPEFGCGRFRAAWSTRTTRRLRPPRCENSVRRPVCRRRSSPIWARSTPTPACSPPPSRSSSRRPRRRKRPRARRPSGPTPPGGSESGGDDEQEGPEVERTAWHTLEQVEALIATGRLRCGISLAALAVARTWLRQGRPGALDVT